MRWPLWLLPAIWLLATEAAALPWTASLFNPARLLPYPWSLPLLSFRLKSITTPWSTSPDTKAFTLRHGLHKGASLHPGLDARKDYDVSALLRTSDITTSPLVLRSKRQTIQRLRSPAEYLSARRAAFTAQQATLPDAGEFEWEEVEVEVPDVSDRETVVSMAKMASNAYEDGGKNSSGWYELDGKYNLTNSFGWEEDGIRGHVFSTADNKTVVIAIKGTTAGLFGGGGDTMNNDRINDNLLFSCCCARESWTWKPVCDCYRSSPTAKSCSSTCVTRALVKDSVYYPIATNLYNNVSYMFPNARIWLAGHSLGGSIASLLGTTFGAPTVAFEAPGERMAAKRLHLPMPPAMRTGVREDGKEEVDWKMVPITHVYHTADPIVMGTCNGFGSVCFEAGYAMDSKCHLGQSIVYDTVRELRWGVSIRTHSIHTVIDSVLTLDRKWGGRKEKGNGTMKGSVSTSTWWGWGRNGQDGDGDDGENEGRDVPDPEAEDDCVDCVDWTYL